METALQELPVVLKLTTELNKRVTEALPSHTEILVPGQKIGFLKWPEMIRLTQEDKKERGIVVSQRGKKILVSDIYEGKEGEITTPDLPHGRSSFFPGNRVADIHTHYMGKDYKPPTTCVSDKDLKAFSTSEDPAVVVIDLGGAHLIVDIGKTDSRQILPKKIVTAIYNSVADRDGLMIEVQQTLAKQLPEYGLAYYFSPSRIDDTGKVIMPQPDSAGYIKFTKP